MTGRKPPKLIVWLDEIEKTGLANRQDTSGVNQDQEGTLLSWMEDYDVFGVMLLGVPGCGKSAICKAVGAEFDRVVIRIDLGAMQGSLVGQSQNYIRSALKVVQAIGGSDTLWLATSNSISGLSGAMKSRFTDTFFFDLPPVEERRPIWDVWLKKNGLVGEPYAEDEGWVARNIKKCCDKAFRMSIPIAEAAAYITPVGLTDREEIKSLRAGADNRYLSASHPGVYKVPKNIEPERALSL
jgi:SpoVK/Ycf46/Vps4 family AAA+-type ATPase